MEFLDVSHNALLILMSCAVAIVAGFAGLSMTRRLSQQSVTQRKFGVALAAVTLGTGIWSMHFVAMLGLQLPILFYYDAAITLASALIAILIVGCALILLHFTERSPAVILAAGAIVGIGILIMHYVGMAGLRLCKAVYTVPGVALSSVVAVGLCMLAVWVAYARRNDRNIVMATFCFGLAVVSVHFLAMSGTSFLPSPVNGDFGPAMSNEVLAIGVTFWSFVLFGACMWVGITYLDLSGTTEDPQKASQMPVAAEPPAQTAFRVPCERDGGKVFVDPTDIAFVRADGHYTQVYTRDSRLFCAWPITEASKRLVAAGFLQTHRSYLINPTMVAGFERSKDKGRCTFAASGLPAVPVSRSKLKQIQAELEGDIGATHAV